MSKEREERGGEEGEWERCHVWREPDFHLPETVQTILPEIEFFPRALKTGSVRIHFLRPAFSV